MKKIKEVIMFCPFCEEEHTVKFVDNPDAEITIDGQKIKYRSRHYECDRMPEGDNAFSTGKMFDEELKAIKKKRDELQKEGVINE